MFSVTMEGVRMKMRVFYQNKLWRDKAVILLQNQGSIMHWRYLDDAEFDRQLRHKLVEEASEVVAAQDRNELVSELADVLDIIEAIQKLHGISDDEIKAAREEKFTERGGFSGRMFVEKAEHPEGSFGEAYCRAQPEKYPEIVPD
jgi:predicted house-cleaning noncanonical NTP pyrophosphatase (MazG superfamily)